MDSLPQTHPPGRSRTRAAWSALAVLFFFFFLFFFHAFLLRMSVCSALWILQPVTGLTIKAEKMNVAWGKPIHAHHLIISAGKAPFVTQLTFEDADIELASWWRIFLGDHLLFTSLQAKQGKGIIDLRTSPSHTTAFWKKPMACFATLLEQKCDLLPTSIRLRDVSFLLLTEGERYTVNHLSCTLPNKFTGQLTYDSIVIEAGTVHCHLTAGKAKALWDGKKLVLRQLRLAEEIGLQNLTLLPHRDRIELSITAEIFDGLLRADGSLRYTREGTFLDSAALGQQLPLGRLSHFLGLKKNISGIIREGRLTFRGLILDPINADTSLRLLADNVRVEKREGASFAITANLIGRKISLLDFQLRQHENRATASGEITLPEEWRKIAQAPFLLKLKANIADAAELADLIGISWDNKMTGKFFADGEVHGATNHAEGYLNVQGTAMTAYDLSLNSLKLQLLFQGEKTNLINLDLWSGSDHLECSGIVENKWPHHYEGKATLQSSDLSEKFIPLLRQHCAEISSPWSEWLSASHFEKLQLQGGTLHASWEGNGEATQHQGSFNVTLNNLFKNFYKVNGHTEGCYGPEWISFTSLSLEEGTKKIDSQLTLSPHGIDLQKISITEDRVTTLCGNAFLPLDATILSHRPFLLSQALLSDLPLALHLQCHHLSIEHKSNIFPWNIIPPFFDGTLDASGLLEKLTLHVALTGRSIEAHRTTPILKFNLSSEQGVGTIDVTLTAGKNKPLTFQGKLPLGLIVQKESIPLQEEKHWKLGPASAPLDLKLSIPSLSFDEIAAHYLPLFFHVEKSFLSGNLTCKGTLGQPEPAGEFTFRAESVNMEGKITPLHHLEGKCLFSKEKMELLNATALMGKEKVTMTGKTEWHHQKHDYHFSGTHLPIYQSNSINATGNLNLSLQGENQMGILRGNVTLEKVEGIPKLFVTPFLLPPGMEFEPPMLMSPSAPVPWTIDIAVTTPPEIIATSSACSPFGSINLHLMGNLFAPTLEGNLALQHLPIIFPDKSLSLLEGNCSFDASRPWQPAYNLIATGTLHNDQKITATLSKDHTLKLQSDPFASPTTLALELSFPNETSSENADVWFSELPYWVREQSLMEPTTLMEPVSLNNTLENRSNLGSTGCGILYEAEMR